MQYLPNMKRIKYQNPFRSILSHPFARTTSITGYLLISALGATSNLQGGNAVGTGQPVVFLAPWARAGSGFPIAQLSTTSCSFVLVK